MLQKWFKKSRVGKGAKSRNFERGFVSFCGVGRGFEWIRYLRWFTFDHIYSTSLNFIFTNTFLIICITHIYYMIKMDNDDSHDADRSKRTPQIIRHRICRYMLSHHGISRRLRPVLRLRRIIYIAQQLDDQSINQSINQFDWGLVSCPFTLGYFIDGPGYIIII